MPRKAIVFVLVLAVLAAAAVADAAMPNPFRRRTAKGGMFPDSGDVPELTRTGKVLTYRGETFSEYYGAAGNRYVEFGLNSMMSCDYLYGGDERRLTLEIATMENPDAAAGLFHHHRGNVLSGKGEAMKVGAEAVLDSGRDNRTLYFYRSNLFVKVVYSGKEPVPDLMPVARYVDERIPGGRDDKPDGFAYIEVDGVDPETVALTPGFTFNISFLPPSVWASAPGMGSPASDLFILTRNRDREAEDLYRDYTAYLKLHAEYFEEYRRGRQRLTKGVDPNQGRVVFTAYRNALVIAARPDGYERGEEMIDRVIARIEEVIPGGRPAGGGRPFWSRLNPFARDGGGDGAEAGE